MERFLGWLRSENEREEILDDTDEPLVRSAKSKKCIQSRKHKMMAIALTGFLVLVILIVIITVVAVKMKTEHALSVILMMGDGLGPAPLTMARVCGNRDRLVIDDYLVGTIKTYSASSLVTDSAAAATAYSCGKKTYNNAIGVDNDKKPCGTLMEAAKHAGQRVGIVVTDSVTGASPASFTSHAVSRFMHEFIAKQQVDMGIDLIFGGGLQFYKNRTDGMDLIGYARGRGYNVITSYEEWKTTSLKLPIIALFAWASLDHEIDRDPNSQPSLAEMTEKALMLLKPASIKHKGFFMFVEGSLIDLAGHTNDAASSYRDTLAYDDTVKVVTDYVKDNFAVMIGVSDHDTGGLALGIERDYVWYPQVLQNVTASGNRMADIVAKGADLSQTLQKYAGFVPSQAELDAINNSTMQYVTISQVISKRAKVGWSTLGHTGVDVNLYAFGFETKDFQHNMNNIDVGNTIAKMYNYDLEAATKRISTFNPNP